MVAAGHFTWACLPAALASSTEAVTAAAKRLRAHAREHTCQRPALQVRLACLWPGQCLPDVIVNGESGPACVATPPVLAKARLQLPSTILTGAASITVRMGVHAQQQTGQHTHTYTLAVSACCNCVVGTARLHAWHWLLLLKSKPPLEIQAKAAAYLAGCISLLFDHSSMLPSPPR